MNLAPPEEAEPVVQHRKPQMSGSGQLDEGGVFWKVEA